MSSTGESSSSESISCETLSEHNLDNVANTKNVRERRKVDTEGAGIGNNPEIDISIMALTNQFNDSLVIDAQRAARTRGVKRQRGTQVDKAIFTSKASSISIQARLAATLKKGNQQPVTQQEMRQRHLFPNVREADRTEANDSTSDEEPGLFKKRKHF